MQTKHEQAMETINRARNSTSALNLSTIFTEFGARGIPESEIKPGENVLTYGAWQALGRQVRKGEKSVQLLTFRTIKDKKTGKPVKIPRKAFVFHISQTDSKD